MKFGRVLGGDGREHVYLLETVPIERSGRLDEHGRSVFRIRMYAQAEFCGVEVLAFCILRQKVQMLVRVPCKAKADAALDDAELERRVRRFYLPVEAERRLAALAADRETYLKRMHSVSQFMRELKLYFSRWYNKRAMRSGPAWDARYSSVLLDARDRGMMLAAARKVDSLAVRHEVVRRACEYPWCGAAELVSGGKKRRAQALAAACVLTGAPAKEAGLAAEIYLDYLEDRYLVPRARMVAWKLECVGWQSGSLPYTQCADLVAGALVCGAVAFVEAVARARDRKARASGTAGVAILKKVRATEG